MTKSMKRPASGRPAAALKRPACATEERTAGGLELMGNRRALITYVDSSQCLAQFKPMSKQNLSCCAWAYLFHSGNTICHH